MENTKSTDTLPQIKLGMLQSSEHAISVGNAALIDDNLDLAADDRNIGAPMEKPMPTKILVSPCILCTDGQMDFTLNQKTYHLTKNDCLLGMPGFIAEKISMSRDCRIIVIATSHEFFGKSPMRGSVTVRKWLIQNGEPAVLRFSEEYFNLLVDGYRCFRRAYELADKEFRPEIIMSFLHANMSMVASWIVKSGIREKSTTIPRKKDIMLKFLNDVHEFCGTERSVSFYAERCFLSPKYFARIITEMLGKKPGDVIKDNVILEAKVLLVSRSYSVQQVSDKLKFPNSSFFCKYFKSAAGCSPRQYQLHGEAASKKDNASKTVSEPLEEH